MTSFLITFATILTVDARTTVHSGGWVAVADGRICGSGPGGTALAAQGFDRVLALPGPS